MDEPVPAAQLGFIAGFLGSEQLSQAPPRSPCSHSSQQGLKAEPLSAGLPSQLLVLKFSQGCSALERCCGEPSS